jgi:glutaconate CoA-transferase subunit A
MAADASKVMSMAEAVARFVPDGACLAIGTALEPAIPFAAGHELIRQHRRDLTLVGPISDSLFDQLVGAGCAARVCAAWVGNVSEGLGHCYRRATERGEPRALEVRDHSNFSISLALWAAAWAAPYLPTRTLLGSDVVATNPELEVADGAVRVRPVQPDVTILHAQRADAAGRAHLWGPLGISEEAGLAAKRVIICCEELVGAEVTLSDPNRVLLPETKVVAVVHEPGGSHPAPLQGFWRRDHQAYREYAARSRTVEGFRRWLDEWVLGVPDRRAYLDRLNVEALRIRRHRYSAPADYGDE